jgi:hypothetical protein
VILFFGRPWPRFGGVFAMYLPVCFAGQRRMFYLKNGKFRVVKEICGCAVSIAVGGNECGFPDHRPAGTVRASGLSFQLPQFAVQVGSRQGG